MLCCLLCMHLAPRKANAQSTFYEALAVSRFDSSILDSIVRPIIPTSPTTKIAALTQPEIEEVKNFKQFMKAPFSDALATPISLKNIQLYIDKYNKAVALLPDAYRKIYPPLEIPGAKMAGFAATPVFALAGIAANLLSGNKGASLSPEQQTVIIDGIARYYAEEFKKAQVLTYMNTIVKNANRYPEIRILMPETYLKLTNTNLQEFPDLGAQFKDIFSKDLKKMPASLMYFLDTVRTEQLDNSYKLLSKPVVQRIKNDANYHNIKLAIDMGDKLLNNYPLAELLEYMDNEHGNSVNHNTTGRAISSIYMLHAALRDTTDGKLWVSLQQLKQMSAMHRQYFAGLLYQNNKALFDGIDVSGTAHIADSLVSSAQKIMQQLVKVQELRQVYKEKAEGENFEYLLDATIGMLQTYQQVWLARQTLQQATGEAQQSIQQQMNRFAEQAKYITYLYSNVRKGDYSNVTYYVLRLVQQMADTQDIKFTRTFELLTQYGNFMTETVNAKSPEDVKDLIKKFAAPPSSFIIKRERAMTISLTGQPGFFIGREWTGSPKIASWVPGISLPLGVEFTLRNNKYCNKDKEAVRRKGNRASFGAFVQILDLGAVLNYRTGKDSLSGLPDEVTLQQVFSPGASLTWGLRNSPVTFAAGYQWTPQLREITVNGNTTMPRGDRVFLRVGWDIPMLHIYKSPNRFRDKN